MNDPTDRISMTRVTERAFNDSTAMRSVVRNMLPLTGDLLIIKAHPSRIAALERNLRAQLVPQGLVE